MAVLRDEEVLGLQIPMDDAPLVSGGESLRDLERVVHGLLLRNRARVELRAQRLAFEKLHDGVGDPVLVSEVEDREDVLVRQRRDRLRLPLETGERVGIRGDGLGKNLDRDVPIELRVPRPVHLTHPARAEGRKDLVGAQAGAGRECHRNAASNCIRLGKGERGEPTETAISPLVAKPGRASRTPGPRGGARDRDRGASSRRP